jgi:hypothetical protein
MEAADEIPRQLRLRDLGGVIICDFIDLRYERHRHELENRLHENFQKDRAKTKVLRMSQFGIIELTRQRMRPSLKRSIYSDCPHCKGAGLVKTRESMSLDVMRRLAIAINDLKVARIEMTVNPEVDFHLQNKKREQISSLEQKFKKRVIIRSDVRLGLDEMKLDLFDARDSMVILEELGVAAPAVPHTTQLGTRPSHPAPDQRRGGRRDDRRPQRQAPPRSGGDEDRDEHSDIDDVEDQVDQREDEMDREPGEAAEPMALPAPQNKAGANLPAAQSRSRGEPIGEAPRGFDEGHDQPQNSRHRRGRRGGRNRGGSNQSQNRQQGFTPNNQRQQPPAIVHDVDVDENQHDDQNVAASAPEKANQQFVGEIMDDHYEEPGDNSGNVRESEGDSDEPKRRRRRRGGRRRGRGRGQGGAENDQMNSAPQRSQPAAQPQSPPRPALPDDRAPRAAEAKTLTRTGSADRHLIHDEPVAPQPVSRPKTYRDLDSIPDDFD